MDSIRQPIDFTRHVVLKWTSPDPAHVAVLRDGAVDAVVLAAADERFQAACREAGILTATEDQFSPTTLKTLAAQSDKQSLFTDVLWPGVQRPSRGDGEVASATHHPWVDANGYWPAYLRALYPKRFPVLAYAPPKEEDRMVPYQGHELALLEAWVSGAGAVIEPEARFREALLKREKQALTAWQNFARAARWVRENAAVFRRPALPTTTILVEPGDATAEIANLAFRHGVSPALAPAADPPKPDPAIRVLVAVELQPPAQAVRGRIMAHAQTGGTVVVNGDWWRTPRLKQVRKDEDRDFYTLGRGRVIAYREAIADPGELAFDLIDLIGQPNRPARLWNMSAAIATASAGVLRSINYGWGSRDFVLARIQGNFSKATLLRPEGPPVELKPSKRGPGTEVPLPEFGRCAVVVFG